MNYKDYIKLLMYREEQSIDMQLNFAHPKVRFPDSTFEDDVWVLPRISDKDPIFQQYLSGELNSFLRNDDSQSLVPLDMDEPSYHNQKKVLKKTKKNSNAIKKMGRIILSKINQYNIPNRFNTGVENMMIKLEERHESKKAKSLVDGFNTYHLQALFDVKDIHISKFNLKTTRKIFTALLRKQVLDSHQIKGEAKLLYLNTLKCSSLRFTNKKLANRLQTSENQN